MKLSTIITALTLTALVALTGCGKNASDQPSKPIDPKKPGACYDITNGSWSDMYKTAHLVLNDQCQGATDYCKETFTYSPQPNGTIIVMVTVTNGGPECLPIGPTTCTANTTSGVPLHVDCGAGKAISSNYNKM